MSLKCKKREECILHFLISKMRNIVMSCVCFSEKVGRPLGQTVVPGSIVERSFAGDLCPL